MAGKASHRASGRAVLAPFVTAGDPDADTSVAVLEAAGVAGARAFLHTQKWAKGF